MVRITTRNVPLTTVFLLVLCWGQHVSTPDYPPCPYLVIQNMLSYSRCLRPLGPQDCRVLSPTDWNRTLGVLARPLLIINLTENVRLIHKRSTVVLHPPPTGSSPLLPKCSRLSGPLVSEGSYTPFTLRIPVPVGTRHFVESGSKSSGNLWWEPLGLKRELKQWHLGTLQDLPSV